MSAGPAVCAIGVADITAKLAGLKLEDGEVDMAGDHTNDSTEVVHAPEGDAAAELEDDAASKAGTQTHAGSRVVDPQLHARGKKSRVGDKTWLDCRSMPPPPTFYPGITEDLDPFIGSICYQCFANGRPCPMRVVFECAECNLHFCRKHLLRHDGC